MSLPQSQTPLLELRQIEKQFEGRSYVREWIANLSGPRKPHQRTPALSKASVKVYPGQIVGLVGESGSGKSTLARVACGLIQPDAGSRFWKGKPLDKRGDQPLGLQLVYQDAAGALNPRRTVEQLVLEAALVHGLIKPSEQGEALHRLLANVGLPETVARRYPHQLSGGQRARVGIARALALQPELLICDEAVASLDVSIQAQILNLFVSLRDRFQLAYLFISHDLSVVRYVCDYVYVLRHGEIVEHGSTENVFALPSHPYTRQLLASMPTLRFHSDIALEPDRTAK